ncbi:MAG: universal stress protein [Saprospiraceae bacterium]|nr:universal stress protein [Saprospiraceae bacterium]
MIKNILVPIDFSETAKNAFFYAQALAKVVGANLKIVHVFMPSAESEYPNFVPPVADYLKVREEMLKDFMLEVDPEKKIENDILIGFAADEIINLSKHYDLVVMGTTGSGGILNKLFGSVSSNCAQRAHCPVMLVPKEATFKSFKEILYASNYESADNELIETLIDFNNPFNASIHFVHVRSDESNFEKTKEEIFGELFKGGEPSFGFHIAETDAETVAEGLSEYALAHHADLIVMAHRHRNFWEGFFHKSQTKQLALAAQLPLLIFHCN